eukprot:TRINITY_DN21140_c0_g1_i2.p1 TRINITY_DN21140_c0_g1~~TRINITY_DN21140_c0_g1_i2.p1  ORF type:complete len:467 (-),score=62.09 TRINITY_DN21140_c0_g1_i2:214-1407(-)
MEGSGRKWGCLGRVLPEGSQDLNPYKTLDNWVPGVRFDVEHALIFLDKFVEVMRSESSFPDMATYAILCGAMLYRNNFVHFIPKDYLEIIEEVLISRLASERTRYADFLLGMIVMDHIRPVIQQYPAVCMRVMDLNISVGLFERHPEILAHFLPDVAFDYTPPRSMTMFSPPPMPSPAPTTAPSTLPSPENTNLSKHIQEHIRASLANMDLPGYDLDPFLDRCIDTVALEERDPDIALTRVVDHIREGERQVQRRIDEEQMRIQINAAEMESQKTVWDRVASRTFDDDISFFQDNEDDEDESEDDDQIEAKAEDSEEEDAQSTVVIASAAPAHNPQQARSVRLEVEQECVVCLDKDVACRFTQCGHAIVCILCLTTLSQCPYCSQPITFVEFIGEDT